MAITATSCAPVMAGSRGSADIKRRIQIEGVCEDPPAKLAEGMFWVRPPCTLIVRYER